ncbi:unnamed protein product [Toxocara canis]|uniref:EF hand n=1 Tax=Toxocara canis TaxID=6265 RepID=A0A183TV17_TOXCA|nr:unnamed protein product [Toxocara canis]
MILAEQKFARSDRDRDDKLTFGEFHHTDLPYDHVKKDEFDLYDTNKDGFISRSEYEKVLREQNEKSTNQRARYFGKIYEDFDENFDMKLSEDEVKEVLANRFLLKPKANFDSIFRSFDKNGDEGLDIHEYINFDKYMPFEELVPINDDSATKRKKEKLPLEKKTEDSAAH